MHSSDDFVDGRDFTSLKNHLKNHNDWTSWRFKVQIELTGYLESAGIGFIKISHLDDEIFGLSIVFCFDFFPCHV